MNGVRPTIRCVTEDLGLALPGFDVALHLLEHPLIKRAQLIPAQAAGGSIERIRALTDVWWLKVKIRGSGWRGAVTAGENVPEIFQELCGDYWWIGAAGKRNDDSKHDFYYAIASRPRSDWMLPRQLDATRIKAERAYADMVAIQARIGAMLVESLMSGKVLTAEYMAHILSVLVKAPDGETYVTVGTTGTASPEVFAVLLDSVPGTDRDAWLPEPSKIRGFEPRPGELIFSNIIDPKALDELCDLYPIGTLNLSSGD